MFPLGLSNFWWGAWFPFHKDSTAYSPINCKLILFFNTLLELSGYWSKVCFQNTWIEVMALIWKNIGVRVKQFNLPAKYKLRMWLYPKIVPIIRQRVILLRKYTMPRKIMHLPYSRPSIFFQKIIFRKFDKFAIFFLKNSKILFLLG